MKIDFRGSQIIATVDDKTFTATHDYIAEEKLSLGLGGDSGGPEGEKAGALEFRKLKISVSLKLSPGNLVPSHNGKMAEAALPAGPIGGMPEQQTTRRRQKGSPRTF